MRGWALAVLAWPILAVPACGDDFQGTTRCDGDSSLPCNEDPWGCDLGQTCWIDDSSTFQCVNVGSAGLGDTCQPFSGSSPCGQDMICVGVTGDTSGVCRKFCDPSDSCKTCDAGETCISATYPSAGNAQVYFCNPM